MDKYLIIGSYSIRRIQANMASIRPDPQQRVSFHLDTILFFHEWILFNLEPCPHVFNQRCIIESIGQLYIIIDAIFIYVIIRIFNMQHLTCAECKCSPEACSSVIWNCKNCIKKSSCCCISAHTNKFNLWKRSYFFQQVSQNIKRTFVAALGIEILCIICAEIEENIGISVFGFNLYGIVIAYILGFALAGFSTFMTILGRYDFKNTKEANHIRGCCSFLEENATKGFVFNLITTFANFKRGFAQFIVHRHDPQMKFILKTSLIILITAESACILTAETVTLLFYQYSIFLAIPLALVIGTFTLTLVESTRRIRNHQSKAQDCNCENSECTDCSSDSQSQYSKFSNFRRLDKKSSQSL
jgi:hypothetical protein